MPSLGPTEVILIIFVLVLLFGAKKLPELARGSGRALRIFKSETKGLMDDDEATPATGSTSTQAQLPAGTETVAQPYVADPVDPITTPPVTPGLPPAHTERDR